MPEVNVAIEDLPPGQLGEAFGNTITLDINANGAGWYTDLTAPQAGRVDLLTVVAHEIGHLLSHDHSDVAGDVMFETLPAGTRRVPELGQMEIGSLSLGQLSISTAPTSQIVTLPTTEPLVRTLPLSSTCDYDASLVLESLVAAHPRHVRDNQNVGDHRAFSDILDEEIESLDGELLELLARDAA
jgi:hypothetical protein